MKLTRKLKKQIKKDIEYCNSFDTRNGTKKAYDELMARYSVIDAGFSKEIQTNGKGYVPGSEPNFRPELQAIAAKLQTYLLLGSINEMTGQESGEKDRKNKIIVTIITTIGTILAALLASLIPILFV